MNNVIFLPPAKKFLKKQKDKKLLAAFQEAIDKICENPGIGEAKTGDLSGIFGYDVFYNKTNYELAYRIKVVDNKVVVVIMVGTRENFYDELKRYINL